MRFVLFLATLMAYGNLWAFQIAVGGGTEFPIGAHVDIVGSHENFFSRFRYAKFLSPYIDAMNSIAEGADFYNSSTSDIIAEAFSDANFFEIALGYSFDAKSGWRFEASYSQTKGAGQVTGATIISAVKNVTLPAGTNIYDIEGEIQNVGLRAIYRIALAEQQILDISAGVLKPIDSKTTIDRDTSGPVQEAILQAANRELDSYLNDTLKNDVYIPVVGITWNYQFN